MKRWLGAGALLAATMICSAAQADAEPAVVRVAGV
mgnify:FL=1